MYNILWYKMVTFANMCTMIYCFCKKHGHSYITLVAEADSQNTLSQSGFAT